MGTRDGWVGRGIFVGGITIGALAVAPALAQTWDGGGADNLWNNPLNWDTNTVPVNAVTTPVTMAGTMDPSPVIDTAVSVASLTFAAGAAPFTIGGIGSLTTSAGGITNNDDSVHTFATLSNLIVGTSQSWLYGNGTGGLTLGTVTLGANSLTLDGTGSILFNGNLSGSGAITKNGTGTMTFNTAAAMSYTGAVTVNDGTLFLNKSGVTPINALLTIGDNDASGVDAVVISQTNQIADTQNVTINSTGHLQISAGSEVINMLTMTGGGVAGLGLSVQGGITTNATGTTALIDAPLNLNLSTQTLNVADGAAAWDLHVSNTISGGGLTKTGAGFLRLSGIAANTHGLTTVNAGTLQLIKTGVNAIGLSGLTIGDGVGGTNADVVQLAASDQIHDGIVVTINNSGRLDLNGFSETLLGVSLTGGSVTLPGGTLTLTGDFGSIPDNATSTISGTGSLNFAGGTRTIFANNGAAAVDMEIATPITNGGLTKSSTGTLRLGGPSGNTYLGTTTVNSGTLLLAKPAVVAAVPGNLVIGDGIGGSLADVVRLENHEQIDHPIGTSVEINSSGLLDVNGFFEFVNSIFLTGGTVNTGTGTLQVGGVVSNAIAQTAAINGNVQIEGATRNFHVNDGSPTIDLNVNANLVGAANLLKTGSGALRLGGNNTHAGGVTVAAGTLLIGNNNAIGTGSTLVLDGGTIMADGTNRTIANPLTVASDSTVDGFLNLTFSGPIGGAGALTKNGSGMLAISNPNTISGPWTLNDGFFFAPDVTFSTRTGIFTMNGGTFSGTLTNRNQFVYNGGSFSGTLVNDGDATFNANLTATGLTNFTNLHVGVGATLTVNGGGLQNNGNLNIDGGTLTGNGVMTNNGEIDGYGTISGTAGFVNHALITQGSGNWNLSNSSGSYNSGNIDLRTGRQLRINGFSLSNSGTVNLNGATVAGTGLLFNHAAGILAGRGSITSNFSNAGTVVVEGGTLNVASPSFLQFGTIVLNGPVANLTGVAFTNDGTIQGAGTLGNWVTNYATIEAMGGTLVIAGNLMNEPSGTLIASSGNKLLVSGFMSGGNSGKINLLGGTVEFTGTETNNASGLISGRGTLNPVVGITNNGQVSFAPGVSDILGGITNDGGKVIVTGGATATFYDDITNNSGGEVRVTAGGTAIFFGVVTNNAGGTFTGTGTKHFEGGSIGSFSAGLTSGGKTIVESGASLSASNVRESSLTIRGATTIAPNGTAAGMSRLGALAINGAGVMNMNDNDLIVDYESGDPSPEFVLRDLVFAGIHTPGGIKSSPGAGDVVLAIAEASEWGRDAFNGEAIDDTTIVGKYTYYGDANLDGKVTSDDYVAVDVGLGIGNSWVQGDFNFSGSVTSDDYVAIDVNLGKGVTNGDPLAIAELKAEMVALHTAMFGDAYVQKLAIAEQFGYAAIVPEPGAAGALAAACALAAGRRRRRRR